MRASSLSPSESHEEYIWKGITIRQKNDVFKIGTDALLLGAWIPVVVRNPPPALILDVGTGTGILALMMTYFFTESRVTALDEEDIAVSLANQNFKHSSWPDRLSVRHENILDDTSPNKDEYDLVLCNPPFYFDQLKAASGVNVRSKHTNESSHEWLVALHGKLNSDGHLCIVLPYGVAYEWISTANELGLFCKDRLDVSAFRKDEQPKRTLLHFHSRLVKPDTSRLIIYEEFSTYTEAYKNFTGIQSKAR